MIAGTAQISDDVRVDQAAGSDLFEIDRITLRRKFESVWDDAPCCSEQLAVLGLLVAPPTI